VEVRAKWADAAAMCSVHPPARGDGFSSAFASRRTPRVVVQASLVSLVHLPGWQYRYLDYRIFVQQQ
jgi:hypothetical protein